MSKGSKRRPTNEKRYAENFAAIDWTKKDCSYNKTVADCKKHFDGQPLPFGAFPGLTRANF